MKRSIFLFIFLSMFFGLNAQDIIYTVCGKHNQSKIPLDSILVENISNGKSLTFRNLPEGDSYLINLTKNTFGGTVDVYNLMKSEPFQVMGNIPGTLKLLYNGSGITFASMSIININGQVLCSTNKQKLLPGNSIHVELGQDGIYFIRIESPVFTRTFKSVGSRSSAKFNIEFADNSWMNISEDVSLKTAEIFGEGSFSFETGDSLRIFAYAKKSDVFAWPVMFKINKSDDINFVFNSIYYPTEMEMAYPDSVGIITPFLFDGDTIYLRKVNNEYIFQGDIVLSEEQVNNDSLKGAWVIKHQFVNSTVKFWPEGIVYYQISSELEHDERIKHALDYWNMNAPVKFKARLNNEKNYVEFIKHKRNTDSFLGMKGGRQIIRIQDDKDYGCVLHEMGHAVGLIHEHSRSDRDDFVDIYFKCIFPDVTDYAPYTNSFNVGKFDFNSIMIYGTSIENSSKPCPNITKKDCPDITNEECLVKAQRSYLSYLDILTLTVLYEKTIQRRPTINVSSEYHEGSWTITGSFEKTGEGEIKERSIAWKKSGDLDYNYEIFGGGTDDFSITIQNQDCGEYFCFVTATNNNTKTSSGILSEYITPSLSINVSNVTENSAKAMIEVNNDETVCIDLIIFVLFKTREDAQNEKNLIKTSNKLDFSSNPYSITISDLKPGETYYLRVYITPTPYLGKYVDMIVPFSTISSPINNTFYDARGKGRTYKYVQIGTQSWMAENLAYLPAVSPPDVNSLKDPCYYVYDYSGTDVEAAKLTSNYRTYGVLYNWAAALAGSPSSNTIPSGVKGICPDGWHLPSDAEWGILEKYLMDNQYYFGNLNYNIAKSMASNENWKTYPIEGNPGNDMASNNKSGFSALPAGIKSYSKFLALGEEGYWWTSDGSFSHDGYPSIGISASLSYNEPFLSSSTEDGRTGYSIRCIKD